MKKLLVLVLIIPFCCLIGGTYGVLHDQLTYTISPEYYTKFKFTQFSLDDGGPVENPRVAVAYVGWMATWWMGLFIGIVLGLVGTIHQTWKEMTITTLKAMGLTLIVTFITGLGGLVYGHFSLSGLPREAFKNWFIPSDLTDFEAFISVGSMHNFSYFGGVLGLSAGIGYSTFVRFHQRHRQLKLRQTQVQHVRK